MPSKTEKKKTSLPLLVLLLLVVLGAGYYYYTTTRTAPVSGNTVETSPLVLSGDWETQLYKDPVYVTLSNPLPGPVRPGPIGNPTPFVQISPSKARQ